MRAIKFRMWSATANKFFYDPHNVYDCLKHSQVYDTKDLYWDMVWQQFTGFYDKRGKEIFEGDIVIDTYYHRRTAKITFDLGCFWINSNHLQEDMERELFDTNEECIEVIGNVFENPELLK